MRIQAKIMVGALVAILGGGVFAQGSSQAELQAIAEASGLQVRQVQMLLSNSPSAYTTWYQSYDMSARKLRRAVQEGRVHLLPARDATAANFAAWQKDPNRALSLDAGAAAMAINRRSH